MLLLNDVSIRLSAPCVCAGVYVFLVKKIVPEWNEPVYHCSCFCNAKVQNLSIGCNHIFLCFIICKRV